MSLFLTGCCGLHSFFGRTTKTYVHGAVAVDSDSDDLNVLELPEASGSDVTGSDDDDSDSSEGNWVMHEPSSAGKATEALANGHKQKKSRLEGADEHGDLPPAKRAKQKGRAVAADRVQDTSAAEGSRGKRKGAKKSDSSDGNNSEPIALPDLQKKPKKSKKAKASGEDVFAPVEEFEDMLQDDAPLQPLTGKGKAGKKPPKAQRLDKKVSEDANPDEEYEWG